MGRTLFPKRGDVHLIKGSKRLRAFREEWTGSKILELLKENNGRMLITWEVGVGKSYNIDAVIKEAIEGGHYDLVMAFFPTRRLIDERAWIKSPPPGYKITNLRPRPKKKCGVTRNQKWEDYEERGLAALGKEEICSLCPKKKQCFWPTQFGKNLRGSQVIFATQTYLEMAPNFADELKAWSQAERALVLLDENDFAAKRFRRDISRRNLKNFLGVLKTTTPEPEDEGNHRQWIYMTSLLLNARTKDLKSNDWVMPPLLKGWALTIQGKGVEIYGGEFQFIAYDLQQFGNSRISTREITREKDLSYAVRPVLNSDFIIYSGTAHPEFLQFRLGKDFAAPFADYRFRHPKTRWYNVASRLGTRKYFKTNLPQILDFFAQLTASRIREGKRVVLVVKQRFLEICAEEMEIRLKKAGIKGVKVIPNPKKRQLRNPNVVPIINYGVIGTNVYKKFHCAFCISSYYVNEEIVDFILQDVSPSYQAVETNIITKEGPPRRREVEVDQKYRFSDINKLSQMALSQQEMDKVIQAVGRVRPFTKPREIITFQCAENPRFSYDEEFERIEQAREFFGIETMRKRDQDKNTTRIQRCKEQGLTQMETANRLDLSLSTVKRRWHG
jgi:hypothetical protein